MTDYRDVEWTCEKCEEKYHVDMGFGGCFNIHQSRLFYLCRKCTEEAANVILRWIKNED